MRQRLQKLISFLLNALRSLFKKKPKQLMVSEKKNYLNSSYDTKYNGSRRYTKAPRVYKV